MTNIINIHGVKKPNLPLIKNIIIDYISFKFNIRYKIFVKAHANNDSVTISLENDLLHRLQNFHLDEIIKIIFNQLHEISPTSNQESITIEINKNYYPKKKEIADEIERAKKEKESEIQEALETRRLSGGIKSSYRHIQDNSTWQYEYLNRAKSINSEFTDSQIFKDTKYINIISWNTGANSRNDKCLIPKEILELINTYEPDILFVQECPSSVSFETYNSVASSAIFENFNTSCKIFLSNQLKVNVCDPPKISWTSHGLFANCRINQIDLICAHITSTISPKDKKSAISHMIENISGRWIMGGDFNMEPNEFDGWKLLKSQDAKTHDQKNHDYFIIYGFNNVEIALLDDFRSKSDHKPVVAKICLDLDAIK